MYARTPVPSTWQTDGILHPFSSAMASEVQETRRNMCCSSRESLQFHYSYLRYFKKYLQACLHKFLTRTGIRSAK